MKKQMPGLSSLEAESDFWGKHDLTDFMTGRQLRITARQRVKGVASRRGKKLNAKGTGHAP